MKRKILFAGIDGTGKSTSVNLLMARLGTKYKVLRIRLIDPYLFYQGEKQKALKYNVQGVMQPIGEFSKKWHCYSIFLGINFFVKKLTTKYLEIFKPCDVILYETDTLLHPAVHMNYHFSFTNSISQRTRLRIASALFGSKKSLTIVFLDADPEIAVERIQKRAEPIAPHENVQDLTVLRKEFHEMLVIAAAEDIDVVKIRTDINRPDEVVDEIVRALDNRSFAAAGESV